MNSRLFNAAAVGLKGAGKTTYLAALWNLLEETDSGGDAQRPCVRLAQMQPDREYLQSIRGAWLDLENAQRTSLAVTPRIELALEISESADMVTLSVPDLSGETFSAQWETRQATHAYASLAAALDGVLLFVNSTAAGRHNRIVPAKARPAGSVSDGSNVSAASPPVQEPTEDSHKPFSAAMTQPQVQLVECLQFVSFLRSHARPIRVAVIVSAWDLVGKAMRPSEWVERRLPLLYQYLQVQSSVRDFAFFGVSAQGGRWPEDRERLQDEPAILRPYLVEQDERTGDLARPIHWLVSANDNG